MTGTPAYRAIYEAIGARIGNGAYAVGATIPRELDFAAEFKVSRNTVRGALAMLEDDGLIRRVRNAGTTVVATARSTRIDFSFSTMSGIRNLTKATRFRVLTRGERVLPAEARQPGIRRAGEPWVGEPWVFVSGVRTARGSGEPVGLNEIFIRPDLAAVLDGVDISRELVWPRFDGVFGKPIRRMWMSLRPIVLSRTLAETLTARRGEAAMQLLEILRTEDRSVIEVIRSTYLARHFNFATEIEVHGEPAAPLRRGPQAVARRPAR